MELLIFAHTAEAKAFFQREDYALVSPISPLGAKIYRGRDNFILIGGEGVSSAFNLALLLGKIGKIKGAYNLGVVGGLKNNLPPGQVYSIRTLYRGEGRGAMERNSFTTADGMAKTDLITSPTRIGPEQALFLENFAPLVDREGHYLAHVCQLAEIPFYSFKTISDYPLEGKSSNISALESSTLLLEYYLKFVPPPPPPRACQFDLGEFYFSFAMNKKFNQLASILPPKLVRQRIEHFRTISSKNKKERGRQLLDDLTGSINV